MVSVDRVIDQIKYTIIDNLDVARTALSFYNEGRDESNLESDLDDLMVETRGRGEEELVMKEAPRGRDGRRGTWVCS